MVGALLGHNFTPVLSVASVIKAPMTIVRIKPGREPVTALPCLEEEAGATAVPPDTSKVATPSVCPDTAAATCVEGAVAAGAAALAAGAARLGSSVCT